VGHILESFPLFHAFANYELEHNSVLHVKEADLDELAEVPVTIV